MERVKTVIQDRHPGSFDEVMMFLKQEGVECSETELSEILLLLKYPGLQPSKVGPGPRTFLKFLADKKSAWWIYAILIVSSIQTIIILYGPETPAIGILRTILGIGILGFLPGYSSQRAVFPGKELGFLERIVLSIFLSFVVSISLGIVLGFLFLFTAAANATLLNLYTFAATLLAGHRSFLLKKA